MSNFVFRLELTVPSWPALSITTASALLRPVVTPRTALAKNAVCEPEPIRIIPVSLAAPELPM